MYDPFEVAAPTEEAAAALAEYVCDMYGLVGLTRHDDWRARTCDLMREYFSYPEPGSVAPVTQVRVERRGEVAVAAMPRVAIAAVGAKFDLIFWNPNFVEVPAQITYTSDLDCAFFDPGYKSHDRFLGAAGRHLRPGGRLMLGFADLGNRRRLAQVAGDHGYQFTVAEGERVAEQGRVVHFELLDLLCEGHWPR